MWLAVHLKSGIAVAWMTVLEAKEAMNVFMSKSGPYILLEIYYTHETIKQTALGVILFCDELRKSIFITPLLIQVLPISSTARVDKEECVPWHVPQLHRQFEASRWRNPLVGLLEDRRRTLIIIPASMEELILATNLEFNYCSCKHTPNWTKRIRVPGDLLFVCGKWKFLPDESSE